MTDLNPHHRNPVLYQGYTVLVTCTDGMIDGDTRQGLYDFDTRILSQYRISLSGQEPEFVSSGSLHSNRWVGHLRLPQQGGNAEGPQLPQDALELSLVRRVGCGMIEQLTVVNHSMVSVETSLTIELAAGFADLQEVGGKRQQRGRVEVKWNSERRALLFDYRIEHEGQELHRALRVRVLEPDSNPLCDGQALSFELRLLPRGSWRTMLRYDSLVDGTWREEVSHASAIPPLEPTTRDHIRERWEQDRTRLECPHPVLGLAFERAAQDLFALRNWELDQAVDAWVPNAGVPTFTGLFGRDSLTAAWQAALLSPELLRGTLAIIAATQADASSAWHDKQPGKLIHEMRRGPLSELNIIPQRAYYGTQTTPAMFILALSEFWHWTGNTAALHQYRDTALRTLEWAEQYSDQDGDGFLEYVKRSAKGLKNHAWKDSDEAIRYADGKLVENPIATVEEQAFYFIALQRMAEILVALGEEQQAEHFLSKARTLQYRWQEAFWMEDEGFYAMALDPDKKQVRSIGSNPGHALGVGMIPREHARRVADRLLEPDLFSGWGIRTLSNSHPSYNPWGYHLGTVWPVEGGGWHHSL